ncbi:GGDEF domain protein [Desulfocucumis palustris]|uniref:GGDEF domain protein n=1 Tax=Desulfocucumis palustris TaxID=1898651 RepID=A0A2L2XCX2_9FIRM|nr:GGDEF domain protein [Desulfocucumis palustris]
MRIPLNTLIIDVSVGQGNEFINAVKIYRMQRPSTRIILLAAGRAPGDRLVASFVQLGVFDIIPDDGWAERLKDVLEQPPADFNTAERWVMQGEGIEVAEKISCPKLPVETGIELKDNDGERITGDKNKVSFKAEPFFPEPPNGNFEIPGNFVPMESPSVPDNDLAEKSFRNAKGKSSLKELIPISFLTNKKRNLKTDDLTGCYTRSCWDDWLKEKAEKGSGFAVAMLDLDHFKSINDTYGHLAGDEVLSMFGKFLREHTRNKDIICRYGGEEFILGLSVADTSEAYKTVERLREMWSFEKICHDGVFIKVTFSAGVAQHQNGMNVVKNADTALYRAKSLGRNRTEIYAAVESPCGFILPEKVLRFCTPWAWEGSSASEVVSLARHLDSVAIIDANFKSPQLYAYFGFDAADIWNKDWRRVGVGGGLEVNGKIIWLLDPTCDEKEDPGHIIKTAAQLADCVLIDGGSEPELDIPGYPILFVKNVEQKIIDAWSYFKPFERGLVLCPPHIDARGFNLPYTNNISEIAKQLKGA